MTIRLRPVLPDDDAFLFSVYASTRTEEMKLVDWTAAQKQEFLQMQFRAQNHAYTENYPGAEFQLILLDELPIGRLYVQYMGNEIRVMDISLLPQYRGRGIGSHLLDEILEEGAESNRPVTIHVERFNPALHLYERLGFCQVSDHGVHWFMKWLPPLLEKDEDTRTTAKQ
jgi:ribosomal protein S18 acetylase RimI-like enzyme